MFRVACRSSLGASNCVCSLWFIYPCGDWPLSRLGGNCYGVVALSVIAIYRNVYV